MTPLLLFQGAYVLYLQLNFPSLVGVLFYCVDDIKTLFGLDIPCLGTLTERYAVHHIVAFAVHQLQLNVFLVTPHHLTGTIVIHMLGTKYRFGVLGTIRRKFLQVRKELPVDITKVHQ